MDVAELVLKYLSVLVWPAVVLAVVVAFRAQLRNLLQRITQLEGPAGMKASFDQASKQAEAVASPVPPRVQRRMRRDAVLADPNVARFEATTYEDAREIARFYEKGPVVVGVAQAPNTDAMRLVDFMAGIAIGDEGRFERLTSREFLLTPHGHLGN